MITFCLGFRNWHIAHLRRCLASLRRFERRVVVTYDGELPADVLSLRGVVFAYRPMPEWSRSYALNEAAKVATTPYLCFTDADMTFPSNWLVIAEAHINSQQTCSEPRHLWLTDSRDLDEPTTSLLHYNDSDAASPAADSFLLERSALHDRVGQGAAMLVPRSWFVDVGGFDEFYKVWGCEDNDIVWRAKWSGLYIDWLPATFVAHQWHRRDWPTLEQFQQVARNRRYLHRMLTSASRAIVRNGGAARFV